MSEHELRHFAVVTGSAPEHPEDLVRSVRACCERAAACAREAFAFIPGLRAFSWLDPGLDGLLARAAAPAAARACTIGAEALALVAADLGVTLRLCGRTDDLPVVRAGRDAAAGEERTLLWFQRYSGQDEIVRAAGRFFEARPGATLGDGELDAWLDTAGLPDPDLLLYVGGSLEARDVLLWQGSYAEISHSPEPMAGFSAAGLRRAVADYFARQRRFGR